MTSRSAKVNRMPKLLASGGMLAIAIMQYCEPCIAKPSALQIHATTEHSARPKYRHALLSLLARSGDPLSVNELHDLKEILTKNGWPTVQSVGRDGVDAAATLVLRATNDFPFQEQVENVVWGSRIYIDVNASAAANWIDRIEYRHDQKQIFGTLLIIRDGKVIEKAPLDRGYADFMRDFNGLPLLKTYVARIQQRVDEGKNLLAANSFPDFAKKFTPYTNPTLKKRLDDMVSEDQSARAACVKKQTKANSDECKKTSLVDGMNLPKEKAIFKNYGFPTASMVGREGVSDFFLLVQHAVADRNFQSSVLKAAAPLLDDGDLAHQDYALLDDRVRLAHGKKQLYGTQIKLENEGQAKLLTIYDPINLDKRRLDMAMGSEKGYFVDFCKTYHLSKIFHTKNCQSQLTSQLMHMQLEESLPSAAVSRPVMQTLQK